jgi:hypothetical protein|tara:strand:+ start:360 stop:461 length:102 start_codon:yes stop_codon:yes gene_type:complete
MNNLTKEETAFLEQRTLEANKKGASNYFLLAVQ